MLVRGEHPPTFLYEAVAKWAVLIDAFLMVADREGGNLNVMPFSGGFLEQPVRTMEVFRVVQVVFSEKLHEEMKAVEARMQHGR